MAKNYTDLIVWKKAMALVTEIYRITRELPKDELFGLTTQLRRAAVSIPSVILPKDRDDIEGRISSIFRKCQRIIIRVGNPGFNSQKPRIYWRN